MNAAVEVRPGWTPKDYLNECRRLLGAEDKAATYWDTHMTSGGKRVILQAAHLPTTSEHIHRRFSAWSQSDQKKIKQAGPVIGGWVRQVSDGLGVGDDY